MKSRQFIVFERSAVVVLPSQFCPLCGLVYPQFAEIVFVRKEALNRTAVRSTM